jgi:hypothetical protein
LLSSNTAKIVFDEFYEKKKFLDEAIKKEDWINIIKTTCLKMEKLKFFE